VRGVTQVAGHVLVLIDFIFPAEVGASKKNKNDADIFRPLSTTLGPLADKKLTD
jgi:hypothetical protein